MARPKVARTKRGERTRNHILEVTRRLLAQPGFRGATLDQIAEETGTAKSSILWHFGTKEHLLLEVLDGIMRELETSYRHRYPEALPLEKKMRLLIRDYVRMMERYPESGTVFFGMLFDAELIRTIRDRVKEMYRDYRQMIVRNLVDAGVPATEHLAAALAALFDGVFIQWYLDPEGVNMQKALESIVPGLGSLASQRPAPGAGIGKRPRDPKQPKRARPGPGRRREK